MNWKKKDECDTVESIVQRNTGYSIKELTSIQTKTYSIKDTKKAAIMLANAIKNKVPIKIVGDYDVDGICASTICAYTLNMYKANYSVRLPKRITEGFGLSEKIIDETEPNSLIMTVDNGIVAIDAIKKAKEKHITVIITDHHLPNKDDKTKEVILPEADLIIDPNAIKDSADFNGYCGAGIAYKICCEIIKDETIKQKLMCFVAIATIADAMDLIEENRLFVKKGLDYMINAKTRTNGLGELLKKCGYDEFITETNIGYKIAPVLNAPGRLEDSGAIKSLSVLFLENNLSKINNLVNEIYEINEKRKKEVEKATKEVEQIINEQKLITDPFLVVYAPNIHEGIVGIIAGRIAEQQNKPIILFTDSEDDKIIKGSSRSNSTCNLKLILDEVYNELSNDIVKYGGHEEAAGISILKESLNDIRKYVIEKAIKLSPKLINNTKEEYLIYDLEIQSNEINSINEKLKLYGPFGKGNNEIIFKINNFQLEKKYDNYFNCFGESQESIRLNGLNNIIAVGFNMTDKYRKLGEPKKFNIIGTISNNYYKGKHSIQIQIIDFDVTENINEYKSELFILIENKLKNKNTKSIFRN